MIFDTSHTGNLKSKMAGGTNQIFWIWSWNQDERLFMYISRIMQVDNTLYWIDFENEYHQGWKTILFHLCATNPGFQPKATPRHMIIESASHHVNPGTPHITAHMRQHGKFDNFEAWSRHFAGVLASFCKFCKIWKMDFLSLKIDFYSVWT